jgi:hypothetical protein
MDLGYEPLKSRVAPEGNESGFIEHLNGIGVGLSSGT